MCVLCFMVGLEKNLNMKILSLFTNPHVVQKLNELLSSVEQKDILKNVSVRIMKVNGVQKTLL